MAIGEVIFAITGAMDALFFIAKEEDAVLKVISFVVAVFFITTTAPLFVRFNIFDGLGEGEALAEGDALGVGVGLGFGVEVGTAAGVSITKGALSDGRSTVITRRATDPPRKPAPTTSNVPKVIFALYSLKSLGKDLS